MKLICYGARPNEQSFFKALNRQNFELTLVEDLLNDSNIDQIQGHKAVMLRANCPAKGDNLVKMKEWGVEYLLTRTVGFDHIDVAKAKELGFKMARVPGYSPNAIAELGLTLAMSLLRHTASTLSNTSKSNFKVLPTYFSKEIRHQTVGILGVGKIGYTTASLFKGLGAKVVAYDPYPSDIVKANLTLLSMDEVLAASDILVLHLPYIKGQNEHLVNEAFLAKMKAGSILVNMARGEIVDTVAVVKALKSNHLEAFATDVLENEATIFNKDFTGTSTGNSHFDELVALYPRVLITPHIGSNTDEACRNMIEQSYDNLNDFMTTGECKNTL